MLAHSVLSSGSADPERYMFFLHGILGTRANWRGVARRFIQGRPGWGAILVDLREHGDSIGLSPPHDLRAAAADLSELERSLDVEIAGALGHSFGGKVVLEWLRSREGRSTEAWLIDSSPSRSDGARDTTATAEVIRALEALPLQWPSREAFVTALIEAGQSAPVAQWLAMNLRRSETGGQIFGPDISAIRDLIEDYARTDSWEVVEKLPDRSTLDLVIGGRSSVFSASDGERIAQLAAADSRISVHLIEDAGHWVHVDSTDELVALLTSSPGPQR